MQVVSNLFFFAVGLMIAFLLDAIWRKYFWGTFEAFLYAFGLDKYTELWWLTILEHYHWGLLLIALYIVTNSYYLLGMGTGLVIAEALQDCPFAIGKWHFWESTIIGLVEVVIIILLFFFL